VHPEKVTLVAPETQVSGAFISKLRQAASELPGLGLLILFGSRARGDASDWSDWDFAYLGEPPTVIDRAALSGTLTDVLSTDRVDVVDLQRTTALLRFRAARDGVPVFERSPGLFLRFQEEASLSWCDMEGVLRRAYGRVLDDLVQG
jgi:predicted nucleotidyltransferase